MSHFGSERTNLRFVHVSSAHGPFHACLQLVGLPVPDASEESWNTLGSHEAGSDKLSRLLANGARTRVPPPCCLTGT